MEIINFDQFKQDLREKYTVDCFIFIEDLETQPSSTLYKTLSTFAQPSYANNYRFVFLNSTRVNRATLEHVKNIIYYLDISPYFVQVYTNQSQTANFFESLKETIRVKLAHIKRDSINLDKVDPLFNSNNKMCAHAWAGLHVWTDGTAGLCCDYQGTIADSDGQPYNIKQHSIETIVSSKYMNDIRNQMRNGIDPPGCAGCTRLEHMGASSRRSLSPYRLENVWGLIDWESDQISNLRYVGGHLGNLCNLKCRICRPEFSSTVAAEELSQVDRSEVKSHSAYQWLERTNWAKKKNEFWNSLKQRAEQIKTFEFLGGEPLMLQQNLDFMQYLIDQKLSQDCIFDITTNGTIYPEIFEQADQFKRLVITVSIDNLGQRFEYERKGADWNLLIDNLEKFKKARNKSSKLKIGVCVTVNVQNVLYLPELIEWINIQKFDHYYLNLLDQPAHLSITNLTDKARTIVLNKLLSWSGDSESQQKLQPILHLLNGSFHSDGKTFVKKMKQKDQLRNEDFSFTHNEIAKAMGYDQTV
jgi:sulfatase maturation enzyme AslB (radical SAM superfamily)